MKLNNKMEGAVALTMASLLKTMHTIVYKGNLLFLPISPARVLLGKWTVCVLYTVRLRVLPHFFDIMTECVVDALFGLQLAHGRSL